MLNTILHLYFNNLTNLFFKSNDKQNIIKCVKSGFTLYKHIIGHLVLEIIFVKCKLNREQQLLVETDMTNKYCSRSVLTLKPHGLLKWVVLVVVDSFSCSFHLHNRACFPMDICGEKSSSAWKWLKPLCRNFYFSVQFMIVMVSAVKSCDTMYFESRAVSLTKCFLII